MIPALPFAFAQPWLLAALVLLPAIWWLLRFTPPRPQRIAFPPTRILLEIDPREETPSHTPWWLMLLRILIAALVILALSQPTLNPPPVLASGSGPLLVVVDNGWSSARDWDRISQTADEVLAQAAGAGRPAVLVATASDSGVDVPGNAGELRDRLAGLSPAPHAPDRLRLADGIAAGVEEHGIHEIVWLSDGIEHADGAAFAERVEQAAPAGGIRFFHPEPDLLPLALRPPDNAPGGIAVALQRAGSGQARDGSVLARDLRGRIIGDAPYAFAAGADTASVVFDLPVELRNEISRLEIAGENTAGAIQLLDDRWRRRVVGLVSGETRELAQPLLSPLYYITRALGPFTELREVPDATLADAIATLLEEQVSTLLLADIGNIQDETGHLLQAWIEEGGVLIRFAGPRLAGGEDDVLLPTRLRGGERMLGGTLSWSEPQALARFPDDSPLAGIGIPPDVRVERQVLAEPSGDLPEKTWASLEDGTPLVTGSRLGQGWVVLFHVTADAAWSNLPLSGAFVEMLRRIVDLSGTAGAGASDVPRSGEGVVLRPLRTLDAAGIMGSPPQSARPVPAIGFETRSPDAAHPPGHYGEPDAFRALNVVDAATPHAAIDAAGLVPAAYPAEDPRSIGPWLMALAVLLLIADGLAMLFLGGRSLRLGRAMRGAGAAVLLVAGAMLAAPGAARAQDDDADRFALDATLETRLAYVVTGNDALDETSRAGLEGLSRILTQRTALEPASPLGVDLASDELAFFPLIYWPVDPDAEPPSPDVLDRIDAYMKQGGTILFDTRDEMETRPGSDGGPGMERLRTLMRGLDVPALEPVPADHVLTKTFYLLQDFPGRWEGGTLWVESAFRDPADVGRPAHNADGVSAILITSNDFAGAWAQDRSGRSMHPVAPGGDWQRELAFRAGINIVMYAMTGNYKADQVHVPALLERLGQ